MPKGFEFTSSMKEYFFDRQKVLEKIGKRNARILSRAGAFIRRRARTSLKRRKRSSPPGTPPSVHSTDPVATLKNIQFALGPNGYSVFIGPVKLNQFNTSWIDLRGTTVPAIHEFGDRVIISEERYIGSQIWFRRDNRYGGSQYKEYRKRRATYRKRPFMGPALAAEAQAGTIAQLWSLGKVA